MPTPRNRVTAVLSVLSIGLFMPVSSANAEGFEIEFPAGEFCPGFAVLASGEVKGSEKILPGDRFWEHNVGTTNEKRPS